MKNIKFVLLALAALAYATLPAHAKKSDKVQLIIETDMGNDIDDAIAKFVPKSV